MTLAEARAVCEVAESGIASGGDGRVRWCWAMVAVVVDWART
jgi:hypothetical protein